MTRYKFILFLIFIILLTIFNVVFASQYPLKDKTICVDAGHGGVDPGAMYGSVFEKNINLELSLKLKDELVKNGAMVFLTRNADYDLSSPNAFRRKKSDLDNRILLIKNYDCELYVSIHLNAEDNASWNGAQVFYSNVNKENEKFAEIMQNSYKENLSSKRKIKQIKTLYMYEHIKVPGLLLEVGFLSNPNERYLLKTDKYQDKIVDATTKGIIEYINN